MASRISILNAQTVPDGGGGVFFESYLNKATNQVWRYLILVMNDTSTKIGINGKFQVPQDYSTGAKLVVVWTSTATSGDVEFDFDYRCVGGNDTESLDQATAQESVNSNDTAPSATDERMELSIDLTSGNFAAGDTCQFEFARDGTDAGDTMAAACQIHGLFFEYTPSA